jgi:hypothetical protein
MKNIIENRSTMQAVRSALRTGVFGALFTVLIGVFASQESEAGPPVAGAYSRTFNTATNLNGVTVVGWVSFYSVTNGVEFARLATDQVAWGKTTLPAGTGIHFTPDGKPQWCFLGKHYEIKGHLFFGSGHHWMTCFYPSGELESGGLVSAEVIDGVPCASAGPGPRFFRSNPRTFFHEDGKLKSAEAAVTFRYRGQTIAKGKRVELKPDGAIESVK